jgi:hypothetical protein
MDPMMDSNLRISKGWSFGKKDKRVSVRAYCDVSNLFKYNNISTVYPKTGNPNWDGNEDAITTEGVINPQMQYMRELAIDNPSYENNERRITLGVAFNF